MRKGFTLIELLAVIVILAIIALIATPIILGIINDAKEDSNKRSVENYAHAVELAVARAATKQGGVIEEGTYTISNDGKIVTSPTGKEITIDYKGEAVTEGTIEVEAKGKIKLIGLSFGGKSKYNYSEKDGVTTGEIVNNIVFDEKIIFTNEIYNSQTRVSSNICITEKKLKENSNYRITITGSDGNEIVYETISLFKKTNDVSRFGLAERNEFDYLYDIENETCFWDFDESPSSGEYNVKIEYLSSDNIYNLLVIEPGDRILQIFSTELEEGEAVIEIKDNNGQIELFNVVVESDTFTQYAEIRDLNSNYYNLIEQGGIITVTVKQNGRNYILGGSTFSYELSDGCSMTNRYYWGNNKFINLYECRSYYGFRSQF